MSVHSTVLSALLNVRKHFKEANKQILFNGSPLPIKYIEAP